ncbi:hypothetical protein CP082626L3_1518B, partial [Chlamydia psittaci 08-2626_L3]
TGTPTAR